MIGINADFRKMKKSSRARFESALSDNYVECVRRGGAVPIVLPAYKNPREAAEALSHIDALVLSGGDDIDAMRFGQKPHPKSVMLLKQRENSDFWLIEKAMRRHMPVLAICYGCQLVSVARGGDILQDLPSAVGKEVDHMLKRHKIAIADGSYLRELLGRREIDVFSAHHQAILRPGKGLAINAISPQDGIIEGCELVDANNYLLCVQWHPDGMLGDAGQDRLFKDLTRRAAKFGRRRS